MSRALIALCLSLMFAPATAYPSPLRSFSFMTPIVACNGNDQLLPLDGNSHWKAPPATPGAGVMPTGNFTIRHVAVSHWIDGNQADAYAVVGHSGPNGDWITPMVVGQGSTEIDYDDDAAVAFSAGEYIDLHTRCSSGSHWAAVAIWYTIP